MSLRFSVPFTGEAEVNGSEMDYFNRLGSDFVVTDLHLCLGSGIPLPG